MKHFRKILALTSISAMLLMGCGDKEINMSMSAPASSAVGTPAITKEPTNGIGEDRKFEMKDHIETVAENGKKYSFDINLKYEMDENQEGLTLVEYKSLNFDLETKERIVKGVFGDSDVYSGDEKDFTASKLLDLIGEYEKEILSLPQGDSDIELFEGKIELYKEYLKTASDVSRPIEDYDHDIFLGHVEGLEEEYAVRFMTVPLPAKKTMNEIYIGVAAAMPYAVGYGQVVRIPAEEYTNEKATEILDALTTKIGIAPLEIYEDHILMKAIRTKGFDDTLYYSDVEFYNNQVSCLILYNPIESVDIYEDVACLSLDEIKNILLDVLSKNPGDYLYMNNVGYIALDRIELKHSSFELDGRDFMVPAWVINGQLAINAIDGTCTKYGAY